MSNYMPAGAASAWDIMCDDQHREYVEQMMIEKQVKEDYEDCIYKFYETGLSYKCAEAMAKLWAEAYVHDTADTNAATIAQTLGFEYAEALLLLGKTDEYIEATRLDQKMFARYDADSFDDDELEEACRW